MGEQRGLRPWLFIWEVVTVLQLWLKQGEGSGGNGPWCGLTLSLRYELVGGVAQSAQETLDSHRSTVTARQHLVHKWYTWCEQGQWLS